MLPIETIQSLCQLALSNVGGVNRISITDTDNYIAGRISDAAEAYEIRYRNGSAKYEEVPKRDVGGTTYDQSLIAVVPRKRLAMEVLRQQLSDRNVLIEIEDNNGDIHLMTSAYLLVGYRTGGLMSGSNHYDISAIGVSLNRNFDKISISDSLFGTDGSPVGGTDMGTDTTPVAGGGGDGPTDIYARVYLTPLTTAPAATGNTEYLNKYVTVTDGSKYFIDVDGSAIKVANASLVFYIVGTGASNYFIDTELGDLSLPDDKQCVLDREGYVLHRNADLSHQRHYNYEEITAGSGEPYKQLQFPTDDPLEVGEVLRVMIM